MKNQFRMLMMAAAFAVPSVASAQTKAVVHDNPWGVGYTINNAANTVWGAGNWSQYGYSGLNATTLFSNAHNFVYLEGGDGTESQFINFVQTNQATIEAWVNAGGHLILNAAVWYTGSYNSIFGTTSTLNYSWDGYAVNPSHALFQDMGNGGSTGPSWYGTYFGHNVITGAGLTKLIGQGPGGSGGAVLAEGNYGSGYVLYGGITNNYFHQTGNPTALTANMLEYADQGGANVNVTPEPISMTLLGTGLMGIAGARRRRKKAEAAL